MRFKHVYFGSVIVNRVDGLETHQKNNITNSLCFCSGLCKNKVLHRHVRIVFLPI